MRTFSPLRLILCFLLISSISNRVVAAEPDASAPCKLTTFFYRLAEANAYPDPFNVERSTLRDPESLASTLAERVDFSSTKAKRSSKTRDAIMAELRTRRGTAFQTLMRVGFSLHRAWREPTSKVLSVYPFQAGFLIVVDSAFQVRLLGDTLCASRVAEIRNTHGSYVEPAWLEPGQLGFDCHHDRRILDQPPPHYALQRLLNARRKEFPGVRINHTVFPNSATPRVREEHRTADGCSVVYLAIVPEVDTCNGPKFSTLEVSGLDCCAVDACHDELSFYFFTLVDSLSLRNPGSIRSQIRPKGTLVLTGYPHDQDIVLTRTSSDTELRQALRNGPGWAGTDNGSCDRIDDQHGKCWFGGGGTYFHIILERESTTSRWYATEIRGDSH